MALVIPQLLFPIMTALVINKLLDKDDSLAWKKFRQGLIATGVVFAGVLLFYFSSDFGMEDRRRTSEFNKVFNPQDPDVQQKMNELNTNLRPLKDNQLYEGLVMNFKNDPKLKTAREIVSAVKKDRGALLLSDIIRSLIYVLIAAGLVGLFLKIKSMQPFLLSALPWLR